MSLVGAVSADMPHELAVAAFDSWVFFGVVTRDLGFKFVEFVVGFAVRRWHLLFGFSFLDFSAAMSEVHIAFQGAAWNEEVRVKFGGEV